MRGVYEITASLGGAALLGAALGAGAEPVDLGDRRARPVEVRFEKSPAHTPGSLAAQWGEPARARLAPGPEGRVQIRIDGRAMERVLADDGAVPGSFGDFVWHLDPATGEVVSATLRGALHRRAELGPWSPQLRTEIAIEMDTLRRAGFLPGRRRWGNLLFEYCDGARPGCSPVPARRYDPSTGYVNAVGVVRARSLGWMEFESFSPLGEALFAEIAESPPGVSSGPESVAEPSAP